MLRWNGLLKRWRGCAKVVETSYHASRRINYHRSTRLRHSLRAESMSTHCRHDGTSNVILRNLKCASAYLCVAIILVSASAALPIVAFEWFSPSMASCRMYRVPSDKRIWEVRDSPLVTICTFNR